DNHGTTRFQRKTHSLAYSTERGQETRAEKKSIAKQECADERRSAKPQNSKIQQELQHILGANLNILSSDNVKDSKRTKKTRSVIKRRCNVVSDRFHIDKISQSNEASCRSRPENDKRSKHG
uniref:Uncharacterized protein n=1 Tax=Caenorhabditis japonica TaxID=281687 RepID=A0A8R1IKD5_CAEJA